MKDKAIRVIIVSLIFAFVFQFGVRPMLNKEFYLQKSRNDNEWAKGKLPKTDQGYDVVVVGEEPEGIAAAISSSRAGAKTLLVAQGNDLGASICKGLYFDMESSKGPNGENLNQGLLTEINWKLGNDLSIEKYKSSMKSLAIDGQNLEIIYNAKVDDLMITEGVLKAIRTDVMGKKTVIEGKRFIDATPDGEVLKLARVPYSMGAEDINLKNSYRPSKLNFILSNVRWNDLNAVMQSKNADRFYSLIKEYKILSPGSRLGSFKVYRQGDTQVVVQCMEAYNFDITDVNTVSNAYRNTSKEIKRFVEFLKARIKVFADAKLEKIADGFYVTDGRHFLGEHVLKVNEVLENTDYQDKIAVNSGMVDSYSFSSGFERYVIGKSSEYAIPMGCIIPLKVENILMVGKKISYSSLVSSVSSSMADNITIGETAGALAVYTLMNNITPRNLAREKNETLLKEFEALIKEQGVYLPAFKIKNPNVDHWAYPAVRQLNNLGLIASGTNNNYRFNEEAKQKEFALLLINGIYRQAPEKYSLELDSRIRQYFLDGKLTKDKAGEILLNLYGVSKIADSAFSKACELDYINSAMILRLKDQDVLTMDQVYELSAHNIKLFTGKELGD